MGKALYRKYRSKNLSEIIGQEHITKTLENALKKGAISHAYLFTGPRGVGKTSIARILAHEINGLPYEDDSSHLDIIEIDAASNRRIDEIRELRERVHNAPASAKYRVYIIDEVHMLTKEAFNALLKTLEEPPAHAVFILATTESHKLPETIISRTQRFTFRPVEVAEAVIHLRNIAKSEKFKISDDALELIAEHGRGSFRDSISLLDQVASSGLNISRDDVARMLGIAPDDAVQKLLSMMVQGNPADTMQLLGELKEQGFHAGQLAKQLAELLRKQLLTNQLVLPSELLTPTLEKLLAVTASHDPNTSLELTILSIVLHFQTPIGDIPPITKKDGLLPPGVSWSGDGGALGESSIKPIETVTAEPAVSNTEDTWPNVLKAIKDRHNTLYGIARMGVPTFENGTLILKFGFPFHQKRLNETRNKKIIEDILLEQTGKKIELSCVIDKNTQAPPFISKPEIKKDVDSATIGNISNIFGSAEVLE